jgi:hypothetical protein
MHHQHPHLIHGSFLGLLVHLLEVINFHSQCLDMKQTVVTRQPTMYPHLNLRMN